MSEQFCGNCLWWGRNEPRPVGFAPCRYPLPEAVIEFVANDWSDGAPAFMKLHSGGKECGVWKPSIQAALAAGSERDGPEVSDAQP